MGRLRPPFFCLAVGAIRKDARGVAVAVAAAETASEAACLSRFAVWCAIMVSTRGAAHSQNSITQNMFTQEQLDLIAEIVDLRIASHEQSMHQLMHKGGTGYHTLEDIRNIMVNRLDEFRDFLGDGDFHISVLHAFLRKSVELSPLDKELRSYNQGVPITRFEHQLRQAFKNWQNAPIKTATRRGYYRFVDPEEF